MKYARSRIGAGRAARRPANLSVDAALLAEAKALGVNLSGLLEEALRTRVAEARHARWLEENADAISAHNERIGKRGTFSDGLRRF